MRSRGQIFVGSFLIGLSVLIIAALVVERSAGKELDMLKAKQKELTVLSREYKLLKENVDAVEQRSTVAQVRGIANAVDMLSSSIGMKGKIKSVKATGAREIQGSMTEETAEVQMEKVTMNELVNVYYRVQEAPMILSVKRAMIKKTFENPELLDITMTLSIFARK
jgi:hypothetical protein